MPVNNNEELIQEMRKCASQLEDLANNCDLGVAKTASAEFAPASSERSDYLSGVLMGLGLE